MARSIAAVALVLGLIASSAQNGLAQQKLPRQIAQEAFPSVVLLVMQDSNGQPVSFGSGFVLRDGLVATNNHVITGASSGYCKLVGRKMTYAIAGIVAVDASHDLSILAVTGLTAPGLPVGDSGEVAVGDVVYAIGNPEGLEGTFSQGIVSGVRHIGNDTMLQITAPLSPGSSGGPILDSGGKIIGIAVATLKEGQNLNLAIPSSYLTALSASVSASVRPLNQRSVAEMPAATQSTPQVDITPSIPALRAAAERGDASAQIGLGRAYLFGHGVPKDHVAAFKWYQKAAEKGHVFAQSTLGTFYYSGDGVTKDPVAAVRWWHKAEEQGDSFAEQAIGVAYAEGEGVPSKDDVEAAKWYRKSAEHGNAFGQLKLGAVCERGLGVPKDYSEAAKWYRKAAEQGIAIAQRFLAELYNTGRGTTQDFSQAAKWFRDAAEQDDAKSSGHLGYMYATGTGVTKNYSESLKWYRKAAEQGEAEGQEGVGQLYYLGRGVPQDYTEAARWYRKAAEAGVQSAQVKLGLLYTDPKQGVENYTEGAKWLRKAAEQGDESAQVHLGLLYQFGKGVPQDYVLAHLWYNLSAASQGENQVQAAQNREAVAARMTGEQIAEAQRLARAWKPKKVN